MSYVDWKRYWNPHGEGAMLEGSYLMDPELRSINRHLRSTSALRSNGALVLLGEAGIGKTTEIHRFFEDKSEIINLGEFGSNDELRFELETALSTLTSDQMLVFESVDEAFLESLTVFETVLRVIKRADPLPKVVFTCRTAAWPSSGIPKLKELYGAEGEVEALVLCPLRRVDVETAASHNQVDPELFLKSIEDRNAESLATSPITLQMLLDLYKDGDLPRDRRTLYHQGLKKLCEQPTDRVERGKSPKGLRGSLTAEEMYRIAKQVAAVHLFCGRAEISLRDRSGDATVVTASEITWTPDIANVGESGITFDSVRQTLMHTGIFTGRGELSYGFAHKTYAEFLAAEFITRSSLDSTQLRTLLFISGSHRSHITPQLQGVAALIADQRPELFDELLNEQPEIMLQGDLTHRSDEEKTSVFEGLLRAIESGKYYGIEEVELPNTYSRNATERFARVMMPLKCDRSSDVLNDWIMDRERSDDAREAAIEFIKYMGIEDLDSVLVSLIRNTSESPYIRLAAMRSLSDPTTVENNDILRHYAQGVDEDDTDNFKGTALSVLWPEHLTQSELIAFLSPPNNSDYSAYRRFESELGRTLVLDLDLLPAAVNRVKELVRIGRSDLQLQQLIDRIIFQAWANLEHPGVADALGRYVNKHCAHHHRFRLVPDHPITGKETKVEFAIDQELGREIAKRRTLLTACLSAVPEERHIREIAWRVGAEDDFFWALERAVESPTLNTEYAFLARSYCEYGPFARNPAHLSAWLDARERSSTVAEVMSWPTETMLGSAEAIQAKTRWLESQERLAEFEQRKRDSIPDTPLDEHIGELIQKCQHSDIRYFPNICNDLMSDDLGNGEWTFHLADTQGWSIISSDHQNGVIHQASRYLRECPTSAQDDATGDGILMFTLEASRAAILLWTQRKELLLSMDPNRVLRILPQLLEGLAHNADREERCTEVAGWLMVTAPQEAITNTLLGFAERCDEFWRLREYLNILSEYVRHLCQDPLLARIKDSKVRQGAEDDLLEWLIQQHVAGAHDYAFTRIPSTTPENDQEWGSVMRKLHVAISVPHPMSWGVVSDLISRSDEWATRVLRCIAPSWHTNHGFHFDEQLDTKQLGTLLDLLFQYFDPDEDGLHRYGTNSPNQAAIELRGTLLARLVNDGTKPAVEQLLRVMKHHPQHLWMKYHLHKAQDRLHRKLWDPPLPVEFLSMCSDSKRRLVRTEGDLLEIITESIRKWERHIHKENLVQSLWDKQGTDKARWRPKDEEHLSQSLKAWMMSDLVNSQVVLGRELQFSRKLTAEGEAGKRVDILVTVPANREPLREELSVVIEVKGSWNRHVHTNMKDQLVDRYLGQHGSNSGLYVVGWFDSPNWDATDTRSKHRRWRDLQDADSALAAHAAKLSEEHPDIAVQSMVLNCRLT